MGLDVAVADVDVGEVEVADGAEELVHETLDENDGDVFSSSGVFTNATVKCFGDEFHDDVEVHFVSFSMSSVVVVSEGDNIDVIDKLHDLQFTVLEAGILEDTLDGNTVSLLVLSENDSTECTLTYSFFNLISTTGFIILLRRSLLLLLLLKQHLLLTS